MQHEEVKKLRSQRLGYKVRIEHEPPDSIIYQVRVGSVTVRGKFHQLYNAGENTGENKSFTVQVRTDTVFNSSKKERNWL